jgi:uncharacterized membrane protein
MAQESAPTTPQNTGSNQNMNAALAYLVGWVTGLIFLLTEKENDFVRFHAAQSVIVFGALTILNFIPVVGWALSPILALVGLVLWVFLMYNAYQGQRYSLPMIGDYAEQLKDKIGK